MALPAPPPRSTGRRITVAEYLAIEAQATDRHEFHDGRVIAMAGGSVNHGTIIVNLVTALRNLTKGTPCRPYESNVRVGLARSAKYVYPDVFVVCGPPEFDPRDPNKGTVLNPRVIVEVLSDSTESYDRGKKFSYYRDFEAFREYVLVSQNEPNIETVSRSDEGGWTFATFAGSEATLRLKGLSITIPLDEIYDGVEFPLNPASPVTDDAPQP